MGGGGGGGGGMRRCECATSVTGAGVVLSEEVSQLGGVVPQDRAQRCQVPGRSF